MANKKTQREFFMDAIGVAMNAGRDDLVEFFEGRIEALNKKTASRKPTKTQEANEALKSSILEVLTDEGQTVTEVLTKLNDNTLSNQKVSAVLRQMVEAGTVVKFTDKKKSLFKMA